MKTFALFLACMLLCCKNVAGQTLLSEQEAYSRDRTVSKSGYTYRCDVLEESGFVTFYNTANKWTNKKNVFVATGEYYDMEGPKGAVAIVEDLDMESQSFKIVDEAFTFETAKQLGPHKLGITLHLNPTTGKVDDVVFEYFTQSLYSRVPVSVYRDIELKLKEQIHFTTTDIGKQLNYIITGWLQTPRGKLELIKEPLPSIDE